MKEESRSKAGKAQSDMAQLTKKRLSNTDILRHAITSIFGSAQKANIFRREYGKKAYLSVLQAHWDKINEFVGRSAHKLKSQGPKKMLVPKGANINPSEEWLHIRPPGSEPYVNTFKEAMTLHPAMRSIILESDDPWKTAHAIHYHGNRILQVRDKLANKREARVADILGKLAENEQDVRHIGNILHEGHESNKENNVPEGINGLVYLVADEHKATVHQWLRLIRLARQKGVSLNRVRAHAHDSGIESAFEALKSRPDIDAG